MNSALLRADLAHKAKPQLSVLPSSQCCSANPAWRINRSAYGCLKQWQPFPAVSDDLWWRFVLPREQKGTNMWTTLATGSALLVLPARLLWSNILVLCAVPQRNWHCRQPQLSCKGVKSRIREIPSSAHRPRRWGASRGRGASSSALHSYSPSSSKKLLGPACGGHPIQWNCTVLQEWFQPIQYWCWDASGSLNWTELKIVSPLVSNDVAFCIKPRHNRTVCLPVPVVAKDYICISIGALWYSSHHVLKPKSVLFETKVNTSPKLIDEWDGEWLTRHFLWASGIHYRNHNALLS